MLKRGMPGRVTGLSFIVAALAVLGVAMFSFLLHMPQGKRRYTDAQNP
ncbi:MAG: hypothetical protein ACI4A5_06105 [Hominilimicola sp.]